MPNVEKSSHELNKIKNLEVLFRKIEEKEKCGIGFKLNKDEDPLNILGVLDILKYKIQKWGNTNIFNYQGKLFEEGSVLVIGSENVEEAKDIILFLFLNEVLNKKFDHSLKIDDLISINGLEQYLNKEIIKNIEKGYPNNLDLDKKIKNHIEKLIRD